MYAGFRHSVQFFQLAGRLLDGFILAGLNPRFGLLAHFVDGFHQQFHQMVGEFLGAAMQVRGKQRGPERFRVAAKLKGFFYRGPVGEMFTCYRPTPSYCSNSIRSLE
jgi:hypothetical protein